MARNTGERPGGQGASLRCSDGSGRGPEEAPSDLPSSPACAVLLIGAWHSKGRQTPGKTWNSAGGGLAFGLGAAWQAFGEVADFGAL